MPAPSLTLHTLPPSHPCMTAREALRLKGLAFEEVQLSMDGTHNAEMEKLYGEGNTRVPGLLVDGEPVHGTRAITARLEELAPDGPSLFPAPIADAVREAERWGDEDGGLQDLGRRLTWGALQFKPWELAKIAGGDQLDPKGTAYAVKATRATCRYHGVNAVNLHADLQGLPAKLDHVDALVAEGIVGGEQPNAADLQIGASLHVLRKIGDLQPLLEDRPAIALADRWFPPTGGELSAGALPPGWVPAR